MNHFAFLLKRLSEASTWASIAAGVAAIQSVPGTPAKVAVGVTALVGILTPEAAAGGAAPKAAA